MADDKVKVGALWEKNSAKGTFFTGTLDKAATVDAINGGQTKLLVFANSFKKEDKHPDYVVYLVDPNAARG